MKLKKYLPSLFALLFVIAIFIPITLTSGCARAKDCPIVVSQTDGVVVTRLQPSYNLIPVGDEVILTAEVQNKGNAVAENIKAYVWSTPGFEIMDCDKTKDGINDDFNPTLAPPRLDICSSGDANAIQWRLKAGCDPRESVLAIAVEYDYTSDGWASILLVSGDEAARTGGEFKFKEKGENHPSAGPIQVMLEPLQNEPVIVSQTAASFDVRAKIKDLGKGVAGEGGTGNLTKVTVTTSGPCTFTSQNKEAFVNERTLEFSKDKKNEVSLSISKQESFKILKMKADVNSAFTKDLCRINVKAEYHYRELESVREKMGITGTTSQIQDCRSQPPVACIPSGGGGQTQSCTDLGGRCLTENNCIRQGGNAIGTGSAYQCRDTEVCCA